MPEADDQMCAIIDTMEQTALDDLRLWVRSELTAWRRPGVTDILDLAVHPARPWAAATVKVGDGEKTVALIDLSGTHHLLDIGTADAPAWSPDGRHLAVLVPAGAMRTVRILEVTSTTSYRVAHQLPDQRGTVESLAWSPDGGRLAVLVAEPGAEIADVNGSGTIDAVGTRPAWTPDVFPRPDWGRRTARIWEPRTGLVETRRPEMNVWELAWLGPRDLIAVASDGAGEGAWYSAAVWRLPAEGTPTKLLASARQFAQPRAAASGAHWSVIAGRASDRGLVAGELIVDGTTTAGTLGADVTDHHWADEDRVLFAGIRGRETVFGLADVAGGVTTALLESDRTNGFWQPAAGGLSHRGELVTVLERHDEPPAVTVVGAQGRTPVLTASGSASGRVGETRWLTWTSADGLEIEGLLTQPPGPGPFPTVVSVHGGPVAAWRDVWLGRVPHTALLVARGYAVLRPNPRGSSGRGAEFAERVVGDMGGRDVDDLVGAAEALVRHGVAEPGRIGITGNSYGGYMAAWVPCVSSVFAAAVARSPVTDFRTQHLTSNLAEFDEIFVGGDPFDPASRYATCSPLLRYRDIGTPMLFTAGAKDLATPASQAVLLHRALARTDVPTQMVIYPEEGHGVHHPDASVDQLARILDWFERYL
ncbi:S9 family peptidase [Actinoplanes sp. CA-054009]